MFGNTKRIEKLEGVVQALVVRLSALRAANRRLSDQIDELRRANSRLTDRIDALARQPAPATPTGHGMEHFRAALEEQGAEKEEPESSAVYWGGLNKRIQEIWGDGLPLEELLRRQAAWRESQTAADTEEDS